MDSTKLVIIDTRVENYQSFIDSLQTGVSHVLLDYETDTYSSLLTKINNLSLSSISSAALVSHSVLNEDYQMLSSAPLCTLPDVSIIDSSLSSWSEWKQLWLDIGAPIIDLLGCAIYMDENWKYVLNTLESEMNVNFRASVDDTGSLAVGGNWILESDDVNVKDVYFTEEIEGWSGLLISPSTICAIIDNNGKLYTAGSQTNGLAGHSSSSTASRIRRFLLINSISNEVITQVSCSSHALCVTNTGKLYGWGLGGSRFGLMLSSYDTPMLLNNGALTGKFIVSCSAGNGFSLCLDSSGIIYSVGTNSTYIGRTTSNTAWNVITTITEKTVQISAGRLISACVTETGKMYTWGANESGIGNGLSTGNTTLPFLAESSGVLQVSCGSCFIAYLKTDGKCYVMGNNSTFALSQFNSNIHVPSRLFKSDTTSSVVGNEYEWNTQISRVIAGNGIATIKQDGTVWTSGPNPSGYLGFGTSLTTNITGDPVKLPYRVKSYYNSGIGGSTGPSSNISLMHSVIIDSSDNLLVIGENTNSQLGVEDVLGNVTAVTSVTTVPRTFTRPTQNLNITKLMDDPLFYYPPKVTPSIDTSSVTHISYGQNITSSNISITMKNPNTNASVTGSFSYSPSLPITKPNVGTQNITWTFTPSDTTNYNTASGSVAISVTKVTPSISLPISATSISYGRTLSQSTICGSFINSNDSSVVAGTLAFTVPSTKPNVVDTSAEWTFTPSDTTNYNTTSGSVAISVSKADPSISLAISASSISYGQQLSQSTICGSFINSNDSSVVAGTLAFSSPSTKPSVSTTSVSWTFTPSDTTNYNTTSGSVAISVSKADPSYNNITTTAINAGQTLSTSDISGFFFNPFDSVSITGSLSFNSPSNTPSETGSHNWTFTPTDLSNYNVKTGSVQVTVNSSGVSKINVSPSGEVIATTLTFGEEYTSSVLTYSFVDPNNSPVEGSVSINWSEPTTIPPVGINFYSYTFTPTDSNTYNNYNGTVQLEVTKATPTAHTLSVSSINSGDTLSDIVFTYEFRNPNTQQEIAGSISFNSPSTVAVNGTSYSWTFTPSNTDNHNNATGSIEVTVISADETPSLSGSITSTNNTGNASVLASGGSMEQVSLSGLNAVFIPFGSKLSSTPISGSFVNQSSQSVEGLLRFTNPNYVPTLSDTSANWTFTPANRSLYNIVTGSVSIKVGYPVGTATVIPIITTIASNMDASSSPTETVFVDKEIFGNSGLVLAQALTNNVQLESRLSTTISDTAYVPVTVVGQTTTNSFSNVPYSVSLSNIPPNKPALYTLLPSPYFSSPIQNATTLAVMSYRIIDSNSNTFVSDLTATPITAEFNLGSSYANQALVVHHIDSSNNVTSSTNVTADASGVIVYQITKNPNLVVTTQVINSSGNVAIYLPYIFDLSANGVVFGESVQGISADYFLEEDVSKSTLTVTLLKSALKYKDDLDLLYSNDLSSEELPVPSQQSINNIASRLNRIVDVSSLKFWQGSNIYTNSQTPFSTGSLGEQYIQYIASVLFGHPQAQAPIKNDEQILIDLCNCDLGAQFGGLQGLSDLGVRKFIFEQLVNNTKVTSNASGSRFDISDTDTTPSSGYVSYPFEEGDEIIIRIRMSGGLDADTATAFSPQLGTSSSPIDMVNIFGQTQGVTNSNNSLSITPKVWAIKFVIGA